MNSVRLSRPFVVFPLFLVAAAVILFRPGVPQALSPHQPTGNAMPVAGYGKAVDADYNARARVQASGGKAPRSRHHFSSSSG